jgi:hypothetical protein
MHPSFRRITALLGGELLNNVMPLLAQEFRQRQQPVFEDSDGLQYVHDDDGSVVRGNWRMPRDLPDEPLIVEVKRP